MFVRALKLFQDEMAGARFKGNSEYSGGKIICANSDGTCTAEYCDCDTEQAAKVVIISAAERGESILVRGHHAQ